MIGIATTFFWIFLIAFFVTAVYSVKDVSFDFGEPQIVANADDQLVFSMPVTVTNRGFYDMGDFRIVTILWDNDGSLITRGSTFTPVINKNEEVTIVHNMIIDINDLLQNASNYIFNDSELRIYAAVGMRLAQLIPVEASTNMTFPWGAPFYNFTLGEPQYELYNLTHMRAVVPISFENHAFFDVTGNVQVRMFNSAEALIGEGQTDIAAYSNSPFNGSLEFYVSTEDVTTSGRFEVAFVTPFFSYEALVIPYG